jgi:multiple sugar transport system permease protein
MVAGIAWRRWRTWLGPAATYAMLVPLAIIFTTPLVWLVSTSLKPDAQMSAWPPIWIPRPLEWQHYARAWQANPFGRYLLNSAAYATTATVGSMVSASMVAFGFARLRFPGKDFLFGLVLATMMLPAIVTLIPSFVLFKTIGWLDSYKPLVVPAWFGGGAFFVFLLRQFFLTIPNDLFDAAKIDGASDWRCYWQVMMPLSKPALSTVAIYAFMSRWNDFMGPLLYIRSTSKYPMTIGLRTFIGYAATEFQQLMAMSFLFALPIIIVFFAFQQYFVQGVVMTGIKG